ncbi:hypothetical protein T03_14828 [Trichinella britovi]|uniref:Uncharacterized protein n=1 Tax=Trichinella britovi TaxID=45882 RepID=A0A0V1D5T7_TRIBR|nr:hypothetical protein T03_14828 [Trichinella britovi]
MNIAQPRKKAILFLAFVHLLLYSVRYLSLLWQKSLTCRKTGIGKPFIPSTPYGFLDASSTPPKFISFTLFTLTILDQIHFTFTFILYEINSSNGISKFIFDPGVHRPPLDPYTFVDPLDSPIHPRGPISTYLATPVVK